MSATTFWKEDDMKRTAMIVVLLMSAAVLFARGASEDDAQEYGRWSDDFDPAYETREEIEVTGTFDLIDECPVIRTADGVYGISAPRGGWYVADLEVGTELELSGWLVDNSDRAEIDVDGHILIETATVDGETIDLGPARGRLDAPGSFADRRGMAGGPMWEEDEEFDPPRAALDGDFDRPRRGSRWPAD
jgi:hypothetical protein